MKGFTTIIIASLLALASAAPAATDSAACNSVAATTPAASNNGTAPATGAGNNVQVFTGALGGAAPPVIQSTGTRPFSVNGDTFVGVKAALGRSCDVQSNKCAQAANAGSIDATVQQCDEQNAACHAANSLKRRRDARDARPSSL